MATRNIVDTDVCLQVGERIHAKRISKGWSQQILADHAEISKVHLIAIEKGRAEPGLLALKRIAAALGLRLRDLVDP